MVVESGKSTDATEAVSVEHVAAVKEDVVAIRIAPTTPGTVSKSKIFIGISEVPIGVLFRETDKNMLSMNASLLSMVVDAETAVHVGCVSMVEDDRSQKLILI